MLILFQMGAGMFQLLELLLTFDWVGDKMSWISSVVDSILWMKIVSTAFTLKQNFRFGSIEGKNALAR